MPYVTVEIDADDVLQDLDDEDLEKELLRRASKAGRGPQAFTPIDAVYEELRRGQIGKATRDYIYEQCGRIL